MKCEKASQLGTHSIWVPRECLYSGIPVPGRYIAGEWWSTATPVAPAPSAELNVDSVGGVLFGCGD